MALSPKPRPSCAASRRRFRRRRRDVTRGAARSAAHARTTRPLGEVARALFVTYPERTLVGLTLMAAQAFFYNAIFFTYALILTNFYGTPADQVGWYILPFAAGNVLGPILLGRLFDTVGRKVMIALTYAMSGILLALTGYLFSQNLLTAQALTACWMMRLLFRLRGGKLGLPHGERNLPARDACACHRVLLCDRHRRRAASAARSLFGVLISTGSRGNVAIGYAIGAAFMLARRGGRSAFRGRGRRKAARSGQPAFIIYRLIGYIRAQTRRRFGPGHGNREHLARFRPAGMRDPARHRRHHPRHRAGAAGGLGAAGAAAYARPPAGVDRRRGGAGQRRGRLTIST